MGLFPDLGKCLAQVPQSAHQADVDQVAVTIRDLVVPVTAGRMPISEGGEERLSDLSPGVAYFRPTGGEQDVLNGGDQN